MAYSGDTVADRLRRLEDIEQIRQLNLAYRRHLDARDLDAYGRLFAAGGEWLGGTGYGKSPAGITAMLTERLAGNPAAPGPTTWHVVTESDIRVNGDRGTGTVSWALIQRGDNDTPVMRLLGHYDDTYVREGGSWRYLRRMAHTDIPYRELDMPAEWAADLPPVSLSSAAEPDASIATRLRRLEDAEQIRRLTQQYRHHLDAGDLGAYGRLFAADGEWLGGTGYGKSPTGITAMLTERLPARAPGGPPARHLVAEPEIEFDGDQASGLATWAWVGRGDGGTPELRLLGHYADCYVREDGRWRFQRRAAHTDIPHRELDLPSGWDSDAAAASPGDKVSAADIEARLRRLEDLEQV